MVLQRGEGGERDGGGGVGFVGAVGEDSEEVVVLLAVGLVGAEV